MTHRISLGSNGSEERRLIDFAHDLRLPFTIGAVRRWSTRSSTTKSEDQAIRAKALELTKD
jgi:hypothetical protein